MPPLTVMQQCSEGRLSIIRSNRGHVAIAPLHGVCHWLAIRLASLNQIVLLCKALAWLVQVMASQVEDYGQAADILSFGITMLEVLQRTISHWAA